MSSRESFSFQSLDLLIADALRAEVEGAEPSPRVWERIRWRASRRAARRRFRAWSAELDRVPETEMSAFLPLLAWEGMAAWKYNLVVLRFMDYTGLMFRFGW